MTTGNEAGLQVADVIEWMAQDDDTRVILAYMEGCRDGQRLRQALAAARAAGKPVVITKVGTTEAGARSAQSHTASLAGEDAVYQAVFDEYGVHRAHTLEDFFRLGYTLSRGAATGALEQPGRPGRGRRDAGGHPHGVRRGRHHDGRSRRGASACRCHPCRRRPRRRCARAFLFASTANPIDVTGQVVAQPAVLLDALAGVATCGEYGCVVAFLAGGANAPRLWEELQRTIGALHEDKRAAPLLLSGVVDDDDSAPGWKRTAAWCSANRPTPSRPWPRWPARRRWRRWPQASRPPSVSCQWLRCCAMCRKTPAHCPSSKPCACWRTPACRWPRTAWPAMPRRPWPWRGASATRSL
ncbi:hypothetical protein ACU4GD_40700 [Cupriavidus basilensis]